MSALTPTTILQLGLADAGLYGFVHEFHFAKDQGREWRFDLACPSLKLAVELEGGAWTGGRHTRGKGFLEDMQKYNAAVLAGWKLLRFTPKEAEELTCLPQVRLLYLALGGKERTRRSGAVDLPGRRAGV